jgi:FkbM family methyltransferase
MVLNVHGGARICVPRSLEQITPYVLLEQDDWFEDEIRFVRGLLPEGGHAIDIGANYGVYGVALARSAGPRGGVWAFEPTPRTAAFLEQTIALEGLARLRLLRCAVSDRGGEARLRIGPQSELNALDASAGPDGPDTIAVPAATLDDLAREHGWPDIDFVKIDAEGHELQVIDGGREFFGGQSPLVMFEIAAAGGQDLGPAQRFAALGYRTYRLLPGHGLLAPVEAGEPLDPYLLNLFCCKPDRAERLAQAGLLASDARLHSLRAGLDEARRAAGATPGLPQLMKLACLAQALGARAAAFDGFKAARKLVQSRWRDVDPADCPQLDGGDAWLPAAGSLQDWLECTLAQAALATGYHSSYFAGAAILPVLDRLQDNPFLSPALLRTRQLVRLRAGLQQAPEAHPRLVSASKRNLNPDYWRGVS